jgi:hydroxyacylglutathione hydrolase
MLKLKSFVFNPFQVNSFVLSDESGDGIIIDACCENEEEYAALESYLALNGLNLKMLINTHGHVDHLLGIKYFKEKYKIPFKMHRDDDFLIEGSVEHGRIFGLNLSQPPHPDDYLDEDVALFNEEDELKIIHVPGHSPGSLVFYSPKQNFLIAGDVLFAGSIGRTDLPGGDYDTLINGIKSKLLCLPSDCIVYPGHGPSTTIADEKLNNPFLQ